VSGADDFLSRWSRRKLEAKRPEPSEAPEPAAEAPPAAEVQDPDGLPETGPPPDLPRPEDLTAESDLSAFLRDGIPERLRNAALRRMWSLDPSIRDFVGDARDYAYDWNTPGGVPGFGPILPSDDVQGMVAAIFGSGERRERELEAPGGPAEESSPSSAEARQAAGPARGPDIDSEAAASPAQEDAGGGEADVGALSASVAAPEPTAAAVHDIASSAPQARLRRHGGAKPV
jgi:hypothetical protein